MKVQTAFPGYIGSIVGVLVFALISTNVHLTSCLEESSCNVTFENLQFLVREHQKIINDLKAWSSDLQKNSSRIENNSVSTAKEKVLPRDCADIFNAGNTTDGKYRVYTRLINKPIEVYCDMSKNSGGWTVIQRRKDGSVNFNRDWETYRKGFGNLEGEFWIGNENIAALVEQKVYELYIHLEDFESNKRFASYHGFYVAPEWDYFRLYIGPYTGNAGDSLSFSNKMVFSTTDSDNDALSGHHCAQRHSGGFWFKDCFRAGLNLPYRVSSVVPAAWKGVIWNTWHGDSYSLKSTEMKIRPVDFVANKVALI